MKLTCVRLDGALGLFLLLLLRKVLGKPLYEQPIYFPGEQYHEPLDTHTNEMGPSLNQAYEHTRSYIQRGLQSSLPKGYLGPYQQSEFSVNQPSSYETQEENVPIRKEMRGIQINHEGKQSQSNQEEVQRTLVYHKPEHQESSPDYQTPVHISTHHAADGQPRSEEEIVEGAYPHIELHQKEPATEEQNISQHQKSHSSQVSQHAENGPMHDFSNAYGDQKKFQTNHYLLGNHKGFTHMQAKRTRDNAQEDLTSILNQPLTSEQQEKQNSLHPNVKQAIDNIMKDMERATIYKENQKKQHNVQKHLDADRTVSNKTGTDSVLIKSTTANGNIDLFELLDQLHQLEGSPKHRNITWCEEKIKEFLKALRHKYENGVLIDQKVQEDTLHQILVNDKHTGVTDQNEEVYEPPFKKVTIIPLGIHQTHGIEQYTENNDGQELSTFKKDSNNHKHQLPYKKANLTSNINLTHNSDADMDQEILNTFTQQSNILSGELQQDNKSQMDILSHKYQQESQPPPFTSDNHKPSEQMSPELPELMQGSSDEVSVSDTGDANIEGFQSSIVSQNRPIDGNTGGRDINNEEDLENAFGHMISSSDQEHSYSPNENNNGGYKGFQPGTLKFNGTRTEKEDENHAGLPFYPDPSTPEGFQPRPLGQLDLELPEYLPKDDPDTPKELPTDQIDLDLPEHNATWETSVAKQDGENTDLNRIESEQDTFVHNDNDSQDNISRNQESFEQGAMQHHVHGRPQVTLEEREEASGSNERHDIFNISTQDNVAKKQVQDGSIKASGFHDQQEYYETLIEELVQIESLPGHQAIDKCEEKILEFLEILKYQQELGFGKNQQELAQLHKTLIEQTEKHSQQSHNQNGTRTSPPTSFWRKLQKKIRTTYEKARETAKKAVGF